MAASFRGKGVILIVLAVFTMACSLGGLLPGGDDEASSDVFRSEAGGYSFVPVEGYQVTEDFGITEMLAPGATSETGPMLAMIGGTSEEALDNETLLERMTPSFSDVELSKSKPKGIKVGGVAGLDVELTSTTGEDAVGRLVIVMVEPTQQFVMLGMSPTDDWKATNKDFDKVLKSIEFFTPAQIVVQ